MISTIKWHNPEYLWLCIPLAVLSALELWTFLGADPNALSFGSLHLFGEKDRFRRFRQNHGMRLFQLGRSIGLLFLILSISGPYTENRLRTIHRSGIDLFLVLDISDSMAAEDFKPHNRLFVAKRVIAEFIKGRNRDRIGLIIFGGEAYLQCPLTLDYHILTMLVDRIAFDSIRAPGTAIGDALGLATNLLYRSKAKSKVIVLLTDGVNNRGRIDPSTIAKAAGSFGIRIYTIGIGKQGRVSGTLPGSGQRFTILNHFDEPMLMDVASVSHGRYFHAGDEKELTKVMSEIDKMERTTFNQRQFRETKEYFPECLAVSFLFFLILGIVEKGYVRKFP